MTYDFPTYSVNNNDSAIVMDLRKRKRKKKKREMSAEDKITATVEESDSGTVSTKQWVN